MKGQFKHMPMPCAFIFTWDRKLVVNWLSNFHGLTDIRRKIVEVYQIIQMDFFLYWKKNLEFHVSHIPHMTVEWGLEIQNHWKCQLFVIYKILKSVTILFFSICLYTSFKENVSFLQINLNLISLYPSFRLHAL